MFTRIKTQEEISAIRVSGGMLAAVLKLIEKSAVPGMSGLDVSALAKKELKQLGGAPAFLGYNGFPDVICISTNDEVVHGIPNDKVFQEGDLVSFDFGVTYKGMITDSAFSMILGSTSITTAKMLLEATEDSMYAGIQKIKNGVRIGDIGSAIQRVLERSHLGIVRELVGHGVGHNLHEEPDIPNYGIGGTGPVLRSGMTVAIEPMATLGAHDIQMDEDGWTIRTRDGSLAAHFEHTVLVTDKGYEILTDRS